jgi:hypothetical protein
MSLTYITITETFSDGQGNPESNVAPVFTPSAVVYSSGQQVVTPAAPIQARSVGGQLKNASGGALQLLATGQAGLAVEGQTWVQAARQERIRRP